VLDGPSDNTREVMREMLREIPHLKVIDRPVNRGKGHTVKEGMRRAAGRIRLFTDADNSTDIAHFEKMKPFFNEGYDLVIASRNSKDAPNAEEAVPQAWYKRWTGRVGNLVCTASRRSWYLGYPMRIQSFPRRGGRENFLRRENRGMGI
jgi:dolichyl-phosphate beta-glucosyltransferase